MTSVDPRTAHIVVLGASKTGTTGAYTSVKHGLLRSGVRAHAIFEPPNAAVVDSLFRLAQGTPVLLKTTLDRSDRTLPDPLAFDRRLMTVRDPRDTLISTLLFRPLTRRAIERVDVGAVDKFAAALRRKEADPQAVSVRDLFALSESLGIGSAPYRSMVRNLARQLELISRYDFYQIRYEDLVRDNLSGPSDYLGFPISNVRDTTSKKFGHISRSAGFDEFRTWFLPTDLAFYNSMFGEALSALGYDLDVTLAPELGIDPSTSSEYVLTGATERRRNLRELGSARRRSHEVTRVSGSAESVDVLMSFAEDGDPIAALRVAESLSSDPDGTDIKAALEWARMAAIRGSAGGARLTVQLLQALDSDEPAVHREIRVWEAELRRRGPVDESAAHRADKLEREVIAVQNSVRFQVGSALVDLAQRPYRNGPTAVRDLVALWRDRRIRRRSGPDTNADSPASSHEPTSVDMATQVPGVDSAAPARASVTDS